MSNFLKNVGVRVAIAAVVLGGFFAYNFFTGDKKAKEEAAKAMPKVGECFEQGGTMVNVSFDVLPCTDEKALYQVVQHLTSDEAKGTDSDIQELCDKVQGLSLTSEASQAGRKGKVAACAVLNLAEGDCVREDIMGAIEKTSCSPGHSQVQSVVRGASPEEILDEAKQQAACGEGAEFALPNVHTLDLLCMGPAA